MSLRQIVAGLLTFSTLVSGPASAPSVDAQPAPPSADAPAAPADEAAGEANETTPPRVSYLHGEVSFWRPGADDWTPAKLNTPVAPGDVFYTGAGGNVELQVGPRAFVRAAENTQLGFDNQEPDFLQFHVTGGHAALDIREMPAGDALELGTPNAVFTVERAGFYRVDVAENTTTFRTHRGGSVTMTPAGGAAAPIAANQQIVVTGTDSPAVATTAAPELTAWDRWNYDRTAYVLRPVNTGHVPAGVYGAEELEQHGTWRSDATYGSVWVPSSVPSGWVPYSTGRWIWDARFGWTWLDDAPWGWAPYHYGRWVFVRSHWAWAPGPVVVRPVYSPALVVFLGGGVRVGIGVRPVYWAPLAWGEPLIPWWGRPGFVGVVTWRGWGGPRVVNNVVVQRTTVVNVTNVNVYRNVNVNRAVVGVSSDRFGRNERPRRVADADARQLSPVRGALDVKPVAESVAVAEGRAARPPAALRSRSAVATRPPHDAASTVRSQGLAATRTPEPAAAPRLVPSPRRERGPDRASTGPNGGAQRGPEQRRDDVGRSDRDERQERGDRPERGERREGGDRPERGQQQATPAPPIRPQPAPPPARGEQRDPNDRPGRGERPERDDRQDRGERRERGDRPERGQQQATPAPPSPPARPQPPAPPARGEQQDRNNRQDRGERPERGERRERGQSVAPATPQQPSAAPAQPPAPPRPAPQSPAPAPRQAAPPPAPRIEGPERGREERGDRRDRGPQQAAPVPQRQIAPPAPPPARPEPAPNRSEPQDRGERQDRGDRQERGPRSERIERPDRGERQEREPQRRSERQQRTERAER
jgi:hypothetical protein